jgi:hypothetical protein
MYVYLHELGNFKSGGPHLSFSTTARTFQTHSRARERSIKGHDFPESKVYPSSADISFTSLM